MFYFIINKLNLLLINNDLLSFLFEIENKSLFISCVYILLLLEGIWEDSLYLLLFLGIVDNFEFFSKLK